ncbi:MAG: hypothetical protein ACREFY_02540 [Acetobacteraceae bacterium]
MTFAIVKVNDGGWHSPRIGLSLVVSAVCLALFVRHCLRSSNPFVDPALFRIRQFTGATLALAPYSIAFGAMLFSVAVWEQTPGAGRRCKPAWRSHPDRCWFRPPRCCSPAG